MKNTFFIIVLMILTCSCSSEQVKISEPFSFKTFQIQKSGLNDKQFKIENVYYYKFTTNFQVQVNRVSCYVLLVSGSPEKCIQKEPDKELRDYIYPPKNLITCYIPASDLKIVEQLYDMKCEDRINIISGTGKYPSLMEGKSCILISLTPDFKIPNTTVGIFINEIDTVKKSGD